MLLSAAVLSTDLGLASQYNNLRTDAISHKHSGGTTPVIGMLNNKFLTGETSGGVAKSLLGVDASNVLQLGASGLTVNVPVATTIAAMLTNSQASAHGGVVLTSTVGTNPASLQFNNTGGAGYVGLDNSTGATFGGSAYALSLFAPASSGIELVPAGSPAVRASLSTAGVLTVRGGLGVTGNLGLFGTSPAAKQTVSGSRGANAALASLLTALAAYGLVTDSSS